MTVKKRQMAKRKSSNGPALRLKVRQTKKPSHSPTIRHDKTTRKQPRHTNPEALVLAKNIAAIVQDKKATDVLIIDTSTRAFAVGYDYVVLATGQAERQLDAITQALTKELKPRNIQPSGIEASPNWILLNYDDVVVHLFTQDKRSMYDYEGLWSDAP